MARAKRTERAEARRRYRSVTGAAESPDLEIDEAEAERMSAHLPTGQGVIF